MAPTLNPPQTVQTFMLQSFMLLTQGAQLGHFCARLAPTIWTKTLMQVFVENFVNFELAVIFGGMKIII